MITYIIRGLIVIIFHQESGLYDNSIIVLIGDNGAGDLETDGGSNYPLRGYKGNVYEGGTRTPGFIHSPLLNRTG